MSSIRPLAEIEREAILAALKEIKHVGRAAVALGISANTLYNRMLRYGIRLDGSNIVPLDAART